MHWTTITMEFDTVAQKGEITNQFIKAAIAGLGLTYKVKVKEIKLPKTKIIVGVEIRYPSDLTEAQVAALIASMQGIFAAWMTPPVPDQLFLEGGINETNGLVLGAALPYVPGKIVDARVAYIDPDTGGISTGGYVRAGVSGNVYNFVAALAVPIPTLLYFISDGDLTVTIPTNEAITIKDALDNTLVLPNRTQPIVVSPTGSGGALYGEQVFWVDASGKLYLFSARDAILGFVIPTSYEDAVDNNLGGW